MPEKFKLNRDEIREQVERFGEIVSFVRCRGGWVTSAPHEREVRIDCLPGSTLAADLKAVGWDIRPDMPPETERVDHAGLVTVERLYFPLPDLQSDYS